MPNVFRSVATQNVGTSFATVYTCPALTQATVIGMTLANTGTTAITCSVRVTIGLTTVFVVRDALIPTGGSLVVAGGDLKIALAAGNLIQASASVGTSMDALVSVLEIS